MVTGKPGAVQSAQRRQSGLARALREIGRIERTLFVLDWLSNSKLRQRVRRGLNKGEAENALKRAVFMHRLGKVRERTFENQQNRVSLNLVVAAIVLWNTVQLTKIAEQQDLDDEVLEHLSPLGWDHIGLSGDYNWTTLDDGAESPLPLDFFRSVS